MNLESKPLFFTKSLKTPSAAGLLQMLPRHTNRTEKGLVSASVDGEEAAIDAFVTDPDEKEVLDLREWERKVDFSRDGNWGGRRRNGVFREGRLEEWQNRKFEGVATVLCNTLILLGHRKYYMEMC